MARCIAICSVNRGSGKSVVAVNLSLALKEFGKRVLLVDFSDSDKLSKYFKLSYSYEPNGILPTHFSTHFEGISYLKLPFSEESNGLIKKMGEKTDFVLVEYPTLNEKNFEHLKSFDEILFVSSISEDLLELKKFVRELSEKRVYLVLNMVDKKFKTEKSKIEEKLNVKLLGIIPLDTTILRSLMLRVPAIVYSPYSAASLSFKSIASGLIGVEYKNGIKEIFLQFLTTLSETLRGEKVNLSIEELTS